MDLFQKCKDYHIVEDIKEAGIYPYFHVLESKQDTIVNMEGARKIMIGSNNYQGLTSDPRVIAAAVKATEEFGSGCSGSRFLNGTLDMHVALEKELADTNKELRANKREYNPIVKCKKALARDGEKLRKKEVQVAKQKIALFGVNSSKNVDPEKKQKLEEDMAILKELKDSVLHCEEVIKQNADRLPILEKTNKLLTKQVNRLTHEIGTVQDAIKWYDEH